jgi:hypothetical protein
MSQLNCCKKPAWREERDLGSAAGFEYILGKCARCGAYRMSVFCVASSISGYEPVSEDDIGRMKSIESAPELKAFMRQWGDKNI